MFLKRFLEGALLAIEIGAAVGLVFVIISAVRLVQELSKETIQAPIPALQPAIEGPLPVHPTLSQPIPTPSAVVLDIVLPSGHTPPDSQGESQFNLDEIPENLRSVQKSLAEIPLPTPGPEQAIRIVIPALNLDVPVVQGDDWEQLKKGVGQHIGSANPGENGNVVLSAHNDIFGRYFRYLDRLKPGDEVILHTEHHTYTYVVEEKMIVRPTRVGLMAPTDDPIVTMISCYPFMLDTKRIIVRARLQS
jgi:sortase A